MGPEAGRSHRRRGACRGSPQVVELGEVGGESCILEPPAVEPSVEAAERPGVRPAGVRGEGGLGGGGGRSQSGARREVSPRPSSQASRRRSAPEYARRVFGEREASGRATPVAVVVAARRAPEGGGLAEETQYPEGQPAGREHSADHPGG